MRPAPMAQSLESAAATLVYYIKLVASKAELELSSDCHAELNAAIEAFRGADMAFTERELSGRARAELRLSNED